MAPLSFLAAPALLLLAPVALAQTYAVVDYTKLPSCASQCSALTNAESACIPPTQPVTSQNAYQACFCSSSALSGLYSSAQAVCTDVCTSSADQETLKEYYVNLCTSGVVVTPGTNEESAATTTTTTTGTATGAAATSTNTGAGAGAGAATNSGGGSWFSSHWKWVLMLIIIFLAMVISSILGVWLKRRIRRKRDAENANVATREAPVLTYGNSRSMNGAPPTGQMMKETSMSGGVLPPHPPFPTTRSRSNTAGTMNSAYARANVSATWGPQEYGYANGEQSGFNKDIGPEVPTPIHPVYMGAGDLPDRTYSPVVSPRASTHIHSRPSTRHLQQETNPNFYGQPGPTYYNESSRPVSPIEETGSRTPIAGAQRIREMQSREHMSRRSSPLSASEEAGGRSNKRLSKKGSRSAS